MHQLFQKLTGNNALDILKKHIAENHQVIEKLQAAAAGAQTIGDRCGKAQAAFLKKPGPELLEEWMYSESLRAGAHAINQGVSDHIRNARIEHHLAGREKIQNAYDAVEELLIKRRDEISRDDAARSEELGVAVNSDEALSLISHHAQQVSVGRLYINSDPVQAVAAIKPFLN